MWERDEASLHAFLHALNTALPTIRITWQISRTSVPYMDVEVSKGPPMANGAAPLVVSTYQKPHNKYLYIPRASFHRPHTLAGFVRGELLRYAVTNTHAAGFERMKRLFYQRLLDRGYSKAWLDGSFAGVRHTDRHAHLQRTRRARVRQPAAPVFVSAFGPYEAQCSLSSVINSVFARHASHADMRAVFGAGERITVAYTTTRSVGAQLVRARL